MDAPDEREEFERSAAAGRQGLVREMWGYLRSNKKWWLLPLLITILLLGLLVVLGNSPLAPYLYSFI